MCAPGTMNKKVLLVLFFYLLNIVLHSLFVWAAITTNVTCHTPHTHIDWRAPTTSTTTFLCIWRCSNGMGVMVVMVGVGCVTITTTRGWIVRGWIETIISFGRHGGRRQSHWTQKFHRRQQGFKTASDEIFLCLTNTRQDRFFGLAKVGRFWFERGKFLCQLI